MGAPDRQEADNCLEVEGLDQLFEPLLDQIQDRSRSGVEVVQEQIQGSPQMVPLSRAAEISGKARRYLLTLVHKGKLEAVKDEKGAWLVRLDQIQERSRSGVEVVQDQVLDRGVDYIQAQLQGHAFVDVETLMKRLQDATFRNGWLEGQLASLSEQVKLLPDLQAQAGKASSYEARVRELEAELVRIKGHWWYRLWTWLVGASDR